MMEVKPEQFEIISNVKVRHMPTGATFSTYRYHDPQKVVRDITKNLGRAGEVLENGEEYFPQEITEHAVALLREQTRSNE